MRTFFIALSRSEHLRAVAVGFGPARAMARRFVAGEHLEEAIAAVRTLNQQGLLGTLDHLGENVTSETEARDATTEVLELLEAIQASGVRSGVSVKLSQLGLDLSPALAAENLGQIAARAAEAGRFVRVDMEGFTEIIDAVGGVDVDVECPLTDLEIETGMHHFDGETALLYARSRITTNDFDRSRRQRKLLMALWEQALTVDLIPRLPPLWFAMGGAFETDLKVPAECHGHCFVRVFVEGQEGYALGAAPVFVRRIEAECPRTSAPATSSISDE